MGSAKEILNFSLIIATKNRDKVLKRCLELVYKQIRFGDEVILIDDGSNLNSFKIVKKLVQNKPYVKLVRSKGTGPAAARNYGLSLATKPLILFLNDDSFISRGYLDRHRFFHTQYKNIRYALSGLTRDDPNTLDGKMMKWLVGQSGLHFNYKFNHKTIKPIPWYYFWTSNVSLKKSYLEKYRLKFDETFPTAAWEDIEFAYRAKKFGLKIFFDEKALVLHHHRMCFDDIKRRFFSHGQGMFHLEQKIPTNFLPLLVRSGLGKALLWFVSHIPFPRSYENMVERKIEKRNILMQLLVIKWKADGYYYEKEKMRGMREQIE